MKKTTVIKILMVENEELWYDLLQKSLIELLKNRPFEVINARTTAKARQLFAQNPDIGIVVIADCVSMDKDEVSGNVLSLVREIRKKFAGPIIANSSNCSYGDTLVAAGCDCQTLKSNLAETLLLFSERIMKKQETPVNHCRGCRKF